MRRRHRNARRLLRLGLALAAAAATALPGVEFARGETSGPAGGPGGAGETATTTTATTPTTGTTGNTTTTGATTAPAPEAQGGVHGQVGEPGAGTETAPAEGAGAGAETTSTTPAPEVAAQSPQPVSPAGKGGAHAGPGAAGSAGKSAAKGPAVIAASPSTLTPPLGWAGSGSLGAPIGGVPNFFIESFDVPPFLLPIYQAAGTAYDIPWQVLAAINEVETNYGRDLNLSSAGAEGWMQFLPSSWERYGVDANGDGWEDPYNPADAVFAAARYLAAAGGAKDIAGAVYAYNHSQAYVEAVMLRAQLLGGTPPELLSAITGLTESRFPVAAPAHFSDGFPVVPGTVPAAPGSAPGESVPVGSPAGLPRTLAGTVIYSQAGTPVIAVQDGEVTAVGDSPELGRYVSLKDAYGNTYTYAELGDTAALYPVLEPRPGKAAGPRVGPGGEPPAPRPVAPASAGVQPHSPLSAAAVSSGLAMGAASALETPPAPASPTPQAPPAPRPSASTPRVFRAGPDEVYLHPLRPGVQVLAGTVLGHIGAAGGGEAPLVGPEGSGVAAAGSTPAAGVEGHMLFQIRPAGTGAPLIDPKPILDGWVRLEETSIFRAKGENPFLATSPTVGQVLLASKPQLQQLLLRDPAVRLPRCERGAVRAGEVDRRVMAAVEFLAVSGLRPTVAAASCGRTAAPAGARNRAGSAAGEAIDISAIDGVLIAGHEGPRSPADLAVRRLLRLQGTMKPARIVSGESYPGSDNTLTLPGYSGLIHVAFAAPAGIGTGPSGAARVAGTARSASALGSPLTPEQWIALTARLGEIPEPAVAGGPSTAAIHDRSALPSAAGTAGAAEAGGG
jgi:Transglycosylase SLT domain